MAPQSSNVEEKIARIASRAHGVVTRAELIAAGLSRDQARDRLRRGLLIRVYPGVYRVGHAAPSPEASYLAAVKACGPGAVLSGLAAARLYGIIKGSPPPPEVTVPKERKVDGIRTKRGTRTRGLWKGLPVTTVAQTIVDIAPGMSAEDLARACHEAGVRYRLTPKQVEAAMRRNTPGARNLRAVLYGDAPVLLSKVEKRFFEELRAAGVPLPVMNRRVGNRYLDARWPGLTVEIVSYRYHGSRYAWEQDHERARAARARGDDYVEFTFDDVMVKPERMVRDLRKAISLASLRARASA